MKQLSTYIKERLIINKDYSDAGLSPKSFDELRKIIEDRYKKLGPGTKQNPIDFNDIDVRSIDSFFNEHKGRFGTGLFQETKFKYIDISEWDVSNIESMRHMFYLCKELVSIGDISEWDVRNVETFNGMFFYCERLEGVGDLSKWEVTDKLKDVGVMFSTCRRLKNIGDIGEWEMKNVFGTCEMFDWCSELEYIGDISSWDLRNVKSMSRMFRGCKNLNDIGDLSEWKKPLGFKTNFYFDDIFKESSIKNTPDWAF